eukprot:Nitzschia sp. Nitz4//scaffold260_size33533//22311//24935//NITZ4_007880-RA/size33533-processed-gene-0.8-mRNA-1//-1//CDS//3329544686//9244//frame0
MSTKKEAFLSTCNPEDGIQCEGGGLEVNQFTTESVYDFYLHQVGPAVMASLPILLHRLGQDMKDWLVVSGHHAWNFVLPAWVKERKDATELLTRNVVDLWERSIASHNLTSPTFNIAEFLTNNFDTNGDGKISPQEFLNMTEIMNKLHHQVDVTRSSSLTFWTWLSREWPLMDWKVGLFLWRTFGGILVVLFFLSVIPGRLHSWSGKILRWPILILVYALILMELMVYVVIRLVIRVAEVLVAKPKHRALRRRMAKAQSYESWYNEAYALDVSQKRDIWQRTESNMDSRRYNWALIRQLMQDMRAARANHDILMAEAVLQQCTRKNVGGIMDTNLFSFTNTGVPKHIVTEFFDEVTTTLHWITDESIKQLRAQTQKKTDEANAKKLYLTRLRQKCRNEKDKLWQATTTLTALPGVEGIQESPRQRLASDFTTTSESSPDALPKAVPHYHREQLIAFLKRARDAYGRTALCLSGGAMMGLYHYGHIYGLMETNCLPHIVSGTSAGSVIGAILCTRTDEELRRDLKPEIVAPKMKCFSRSWTDRIKSVLKHGHMFSGEEWLEMIEWFTCGKMTFEEAYKKTGRVFCITLASTTRKAPPVLLNHITAPNVLIPSAIVASAAVPGLIAPARLQVKDEYGNVRSAGDETYFDGSIDNDIPVSGLAEQFNCQFLVAAQANPHVVPFFFNPKGGVGSPSRWNSGEQEASWRGGFLLAALEMYLKNDMKSKFRFLHDMEAAVGFTSTLMTQEFAGSITIVPKVRFWDFLTLMTDPTVDQIRHSFQVGAVASYQHAAMIRLHYRIADAIDECLAKLGVDETRHPGQPVKPNRRASFQLSDEKVEGHSTTATSRRGLPAVVSTTVRDGLEDDSTDSSSDGTYEG